MTNFDMNHGTVCAIQEGMFLFRREFFQLLSVTSLGLTEVHFWELWEQRFYLFIYLFIYYMVYTHVKSFTIVKNRKRNVAECSGR